MSRDSHAPFFLTLAIIREIHQAAIAGFGGAPEERDTALLESAVAAPQASSGGQSPYSDLIEMSGAYLYFLCQNHPFVDGNKRTALGACLVFLQLNSFRPKSDRGEWEALVLDVAASQCDRESATVRLRALVEA